MWSHHTFSLARLEPTRNINGVSGLPEHKWTVWWGWGDKNQRLEGRGRWRRESVIRQNQGQTKKGQGKEGEGSEGVRRIER